MTLTFRAGHYFLPSTLGRLVVPNESTADTAIAPAPPGITTEVVEGDTMCVHFQVFP